MRRGTRRRGTKTQEHDVATTPPRHDHPSTPPTSPPPSRPPTPPSDGSDATVPVIVHVHPSMVVHDPYALAAMTAPCAPRWSDIPCATPNGTYAQSIAHDHCHPSYAHHPHAHPSYAHHHPSRHLTQHPGYYQPRHDHPGYYQPRYHHAGHYQPVLPGHYYQTGHYQQSSHAYQCRPQCPPPLPSCHSG